jgi:hypothetical protein
MMENEDDFLFGKYREYRTALRAVRACADFIPYGWFNPPKTIKLFGKFGPQQMVFRGVADDAARELANGINHLINLVARLEAWKVVLEPLSNDEKSEILLEFVQDLSTVALLAPYSLKARFYFAVAHQSHQANATRSETVWVDDFVTLPDDRVVNEEVAARLAKGWTAWPALIKALNAVDMGDYKTATDDFRNKHTHRVAPHIELGITQTIKRRPASGTVGAVSYGIGGSDPIKLEQAIPQLTKQCLALSRSYGEFQKLVAEQADALFGTI